MQDRDTRDVVGGVLLVAFGVVAAIYAFSHYRMGTITRMGPGMVPTWLGIVLAVFGLWIAVSGWMRRRPNIVLTEVRFLVPLVIGVSITAFAMMVEPFGLIPSVFVAASVATLAEGEFRPLRALIISTALCLIAWLIFIAGLRLTIEPFAWPL